MAREVPPVDNILIPISDRLLANSTIPVLSDTLMRAVFTFTVNPLDIVIGFLFSAIFVLHITTVTSTEKQIAGLTDEQIAQIQANFRKMADLGLRAPWDPWFVGKEGHPGVYGTGPMLH